MTDTAYLYLLVRNDLQSLNPGKAVAHGAHAANQCVFEIEQRYKANSKIGQTLKQWQASTPLGFGTTITLSANLSQIESAIMVAQALGHPAGITVDPSYPYIVDREYAALISHPEDYPPIPTGGGKMVCFREETTAAYVFGMKDDLRPILGNFPLMD